MSSVDYNSLKIKNNCENKLGIRFVSSRAKELKGWFRYKNKKRRICVPKGKKNIHPKTYRSMANGFGLYEIEFDRMNDCIDGLKEFIQINKSRNWTDVRG